MTRPALAASVVVAAHGAAVEATVERRVPGLFHFLGVTPPDQLATAVSHRSPRYSVEESALRREVRTLVRVAADFQFTGAR